MKRHKKPLGNRPPNAIGIILKPSWLIPGRIVIVEVMEGKKELAVWGLSIDVWRNKKRICEKLESLLGGRAVWISQHPMK